MFKMARKAESLCFLLVIFVTISSNFRVSGHRDVPVYNINLDLEPEKRWLEVAKDYGGLVQEITKIFATYIPKPVLPLLEKLASKLDRYFPEEYAREIKGIAHAVNTEVGTIVLVNIVYDITAHCTSIVARDGGGQIWHGRNMDYGFGPILKNVTIFLNFQRNGKTVYSATSFAGLVGILTGMRHGAFSITVDQRSSGTPPWFNAVVALLDKKASVMTFAVRNALEQTTNFTSALELLVKTDTMAPVYYIMAGTRPQEGAVITLDRTAAADVWTLSHPNQTWYLVETNYDHWKPTPPSDQRREAAIKMMNVLGQQAVTPTSLFKVLHTTPVFRPTGFVHTVYTVVMNPTTSAYQNWVW